MAERILIIGAKDGADIVRAAQLVSAYRRHRSAEETKPGRRNCVVFTSQGYENPAAVWHTGTQITVHLGGDRG